MSTAKRAYAQYGTGTAGPFQTVEVPLKHDGKEARDRTGFKVLVGGRWRRVLCGYGLYVDYEGEKDGRLLITLGD